MLFQAHDQVAQPQKQLVTFQAILDEQNGHIATIKELDPVTKTIEISIDFEGFGTMTLTGNAPEALLEETKDALELALQRAKTKPVPAEVFKTLGALMYQPDSLYDMYLEQISEEFDNTVEQVLAQEADETPDSTTAPELPAGLLEALNKLGLTASVRTVSVEDMQQMLRDRKAQPIVSRKSAADHLAAALGQHPGKVRYS